VLNQHPPPRNRTVFGFLLVGEFLASRFLVWLRDLHTRERKTNKTEILQSFTAFR
jgi:hypothetical protein